MCVSTRARRTRSSESPPIAIRGSSPTADSWPFRPCFEAPRVDVDDDWPFVFVASSTETHGCGTKTATLLGQVVALFDQRDCDKVAANLRSFMVANEEQVPEFVRLRGWHDTASLVKTVVPIMKRAETESPAFQKCRHNKAVALALDMANLNIP